MDSVILIVVVIVAYMVNRALNEVVSIRLDVRHIRQMMLHERDRKRGAP